MPIEQKPDQIMRKVKTPASPEEKADNPAMGRPRVGLATRINREYRRRLGDLDPV